HSLAGAASAVGLPSLEVAARGLEELFRDVRANERALDDAARQQMAHWLNSMADSMYESNAARVGPDQLQHHDQQEIRHGAAEGEHKSSPSTFFKSPPACESVRVSVDSLDRLVRSSGQMLSDNQRMSRLGHHIASLQLELNDLDRERDALRRGASSKLHKLSALPEYSRIVRYVEGADRQISNLAKRARQLGAEHRRVAWQLQARACQIQRDVYAARLVPAHSVFQGFRKMVRELAKSENKRIELQTFGLDVRADRMVLQELKDPVMHLLRNCVSHGVELPDERRAKGKPEAGHVTLSVEVAAGRLNIVIDDDGQGIDVARIREQAIRRGILAEATAAHSSIREILSVLFEPGFSTFNAATELAGRGMGLSIVRDAAVGLQGEVTLVPRPECGVRVHLSVPMFVSTHRVLVVTCSNQTIAIPSRGIERLLRLTRDKVETIEGQPVVTYQRRPVRLLRLGEILGQDEHASALDENGALSILLLKSGTRLLAVSVDTLVEERDALILNLDELVEADQWAGGILLDDGRAALVIQPTAIVDGAPLHPTDIGAKPISSTDAPAREKVLIVDDSFTTRTLEKSILEAQGYDVSVAVDGVEALIQLQKKKFALVISDIEMPRMDGFALLERMKSERPLADTPVILVTSRDRQEDLQRGLELGANAYIVKRKFDHQELLSTVRQLV
ncbi:MAG TPA: response regulator, partial [Lacipirellulaceae bacterium]|nr:response regulator [Lacipirellulaceae bacterium]